MSPADARQPGVVLVVEDDCMIQADIVDALRNGGWTVFEADSLQSAVCLITSSVKIDVLFTDIDLKGELSGWDVAERFRRQHPGLGVIYASGLNRDLERKVEGSLFFTKPYDILEVVEACFAVIASGPAEPLH